MKIMKYFILVLAFSFSTASFAQLSIVGKWKTIDDVTNKPKSIIEIFEKDGVYNGKILKVFPTEGEAERTTCDKCSGDKKDQPIVGMQNLNGLKKESDTKWSDGEILDPKNGKTYSCKAELFENGSKLKMRGFIGISLLGRTQVWEREPAEAVVPQEATTVKATPEAPSAVLDSAKEAATPATSSKAKKSKDKK